MHLLTYDIGANTPKCIGPARQYNFLAINLCKPGRVIFSPLVAFNGCSKMTFTSTFIDRGRMTLCKRVNLKAYTNSFAGCPSRDAQRKQKKPESKHRFQLIIRLNVIKNTMEFSPPLFFQAPLLTSDLQLSIFGPFN